MNASDYNAGDKVYRRDVGSASPAFQEPHTVISIGATRVFLRRDSDGWETSVDLSVVTLANPVESSFFVEGEVWRKNNVIGNRVSGGAKIFTVKAVGESYGGKVACLQWGDGSLGLWKQHSFDTYFSENFTKD